MSIGVGDSVALTGFIVTLGEPCTVAVGLTDGTSHNVVIPIEALTAVKPLATHETFTVTSSFALDSTGKLKEETKLEPAP
jgi:hypothetical protein